MFFGSVVRSVREIFLTSGFSGFYVGLTPRLLIVSIGGMSYFFAADFVEKYFDIATK